MRRASSNYINVDVRKEGTEWVCRGYACLIEVISCHVHFSHSQRHQEVEHCVVKANSVVLKLLDHESLRICHKVVEDFCDQPYLQNR